MSIRIARSPLAATFEIQVGPIWSHFGRPMLSHRQVAFSRFSMVKQHHHSQQLESIREFDASAFCTDVGVFLGLADLLSVALDP